LGLSLGLRLSSLLSLGLGLGMSLSSLLSLSLGLERRSLYAFENLLKFAKRFAGSLSTFTGMSTTSHFIYYANKKKFLRKYNRNIVNRLIYKYYTHHIFLNKNQLL
jgi:hypothetical protein